MFLSLHNRKVTQDCMPCIDWKFSLRANKSILKHFPKSSWKIYEVRFRIISDFSSYNIYHISRHSWNQTLLPYIFSCVIFYFSFSFHSTLCLSSIFCFLCKISFPPIILIYFCSPSFHWACVCVFILLQMFLICIFEQFSLVIFFFSLNSKLGREIRVGNKSCSKNGFSIWWKSCK